MFRFTSVFLLAMLPLTLAAKPKVPTSEEKIRKAIDDICGDTWCEGDYKFAFGKVVLDQKAAQTLVNFAMVPYIDEETVADEASFSSVTLAPTFNVRCVVKGFSDAAVILTSNGDLNQDFYSALSDCINALEKNLVK